MSHDAPAGYIGQWADLPDFSLHSPVCVRWVRPFTWKNPRAEFTRMAAVPIWVTEKQHDVLKRFLKEVEKLSYVALDVCQGMWPDSFPEVPPEEVIRHLRVWPAVKLRGLMEVVRAESRRAGHKPGSLIDVMRERATAYALSTIRTSVWAGRAPKLPFSGELPAGLSMRLHFGTTYGRPVISQDGAVWLGDEIGWVWVQPDDLRRLGGPEGLRTAFYVDVGHAAQQWHLRVVFTKPYTRKDKSKVDISEGNVS